MGLTRSWHLHYRPESWDVGHDSRQQRSDTTTHLPVPQTYTSQFILMTTYSAPGTVTIPHLVEKNTAALRPSQSGACLNPVPCMAAQTPNHLTIPP